MNSVPHQPAEQRGVWFYLTPTMLIALLGVSGLNYSGSLNWDRRLIRLEEHAVVNDKSLDSIESKLDSALGSTRDLERRMTTVEFILDQLREK